MEAAQYRQLHRAEWDAAQAEDFLFTLPCHVKWTAMDTQVGQLVNAVGGQLVSAVCWVSGTCVGQRAGPRGGRVLGKQYEHWTAPTVVLPWGGRDPADAVCCQPNGKWYGT